MKAFSIAIMFTAACALQHATAQTTPDPAVLYPTLHDISDARSLALGEAGAARPGDPEMWSSNPANLTGTSGYGLAFGYVSGRDALGNGIYAPGIWATTSFGTVAFHYTRYSLGEWRSTFDSGTQGPTFEPYEHTLALTFAGHVAGPLSVGASIKLLEWSFPAVPVITVSASNAYIDLGALCSFVGLTEEDSVHAGLAVQNIGGRLEWKGGEGSERIAQLARLGAAYDHIWRDTPKDAGMRLSASVEYNRILNMGEIPSVGWQGGTAPVLGQLGLGGEFSYMNILMLRVGALIPLEKTRPDITAETSFRYGGGVRLPLRNIQLNVPITVGVDYTVVTHTRWHGSAETASRQAPVVNVRLAYTPSGAD